MSNHVTLAALPLAAVCAALIATAGLLSGAMTSESWADGGEPSAASDSIDSTNPSDPRVKLLRYNDADIYTITMRYGYQTSVVFGPTEEIQTISVGDRSLWQLIPNGHRLFIRPMDSGVVTNMTVLTSKHSYLFDIKSIPENSGKTEGKKHANSDNTNDGVIYVAKFTYPDDEKKPSPGLPATGLTPLTVGTGSFYAPPLHDSPSREASGQSAPAPLTPPADANYHYTFSGPDELAPLQVYDDGHSTYIKYHNPSQPLPNAYIIDRDGSEHLTTHYVRDHVMVVDAVAGEMALKNSDGTVHIYNETLNPRQ